MNEEDYEAILALINSSLDLLGGEPQKEADRKIYEHLQNLREMVLLARGEIEDKTV